MALTKLEKLTPNDINAMTEKELRKYLESAINSSFKRIGKLNEEGYEYTTNNLNYMKKVSGVNNPKKFEKELKSLESLRAKAIKNVKEMDLNELRERAGYVRLHLRTDDASVAGRVRRDIKNLKLIDRLLYESDREPSIRRLKQDDVKGYKMKGLFYSRHDLSEFWVVLKEANADNALDASALSSNDVVRVALNVRFMTNSFTDRADLVQQMIKAVNAKNTERVKENADKSKEQYAKEEDIFETAKAEGRKRKFQNR